MEASANGALRAEVERLNQLISEIKSNHDKNVKALTNKLVKEKQKTADMKNEKIANEVIGLHNFFI